jgi:hypothetical protein
MSEAGVKREAKHTLPRDEKGEKVSKKNMGDGGKARTP